MWRKRIGAVLLAGAVAFGSLNVYRYHKETLLEWFLEIRPGGRAANDVSLFYMSSLDDRTLRVKVTVRCQDRQQKREVMQKEPRIVHRLINASQKKPIRTSAEKHDLERFRGYLLAAVNETVGSPVKSVHVDRFFLN